MSDDSASTTPRIHLPPGRLTLTAREVWQALGLPGTVDAAGWDALERPPASDARVGKLTPLFPKDRPRPST